MLVRGKYLLTDPSAEDAGIIKDGVIVVQGDCIVEVGTYNEIKERYPAKKEIGTPETVILPGLIDAHSHGKGFTFLQGGVGYNYLEPWQLDLGRMPDIGVYLNAAYSAIKHLESGCTTIHYIHSLTNAPLYEDIMEAVTAFNDVGIRYIVGVAAKERNLITYDDANFRLYLPPELASKWAEVLNSDLEKTENTYWETITKISEDGCIPFCFAPMSPQWCSDSFLLQIKKKAENIGIGIHIHAMQTLYQRALGPRLYGKSLVQHLDEIGFLGPEVTIGHGVWLSEEDMEVIAKRGVSLTHHVSCNLNMRNGIQPTAKLVANGINIALGIDDKGLNDDEDIFQEMRLVEKIHRLADLEHSDAPVLTSKQVLQMATVNGAAVCGLEGDCGKLQKGYKADMTLLPIAAFTEPYLVSNVDIIDALIGRAKGSHVDTVIVAGKVVVQQGHLITIDKEKIFEQIRERCLRWEKAGRPSKTGLDELKPYLRKFYSGWLENDTSKSYYLVNGSENFI